MWFLLVYTETVVGAQASLWSRDCMRRTIERMNEFQVHFTGSALKWQHVLNSLPARDGPARAKITVRVRLVWEREGEEWKAGNAL